jgi:hypothetical protein
MAHRRRLTFPGPFVRLGPTFIDPSPLSLDEFPSGEPTSRQLADVSRHFLRRRILGDMAAFAELPRILGTYRSGLLWRDIMLLMSFSMPLRSVRELADHFFSDVFDQGDQFVAYQIFMMLLETGAPDCIETSFAYLPTLDPGTDFVEIAGLYAMLLEPDIGYDRSKSDIIAAATEGLPALRAAAQARLLTFSSRYPARALQRVHSGEPCSLVSITLGLAEALRRPSFYERIYYEKVLLEAMTGHDLSQFYSHLALQPGAAYEALETLSDHIDLESYQLGRRYFFGNPIAE